MDRATRARHAITIGLISSFAVLVGGAGTAHAWQTWIVPPPAAQPSTPPAPAGVPATAPPSDPAPAPVPAPEPALMLEPPPPVPALRAAPPPGWHAHDGLYFHAAIGLGGATNRTSSAGTNHATADGNGFAFTLAAGYSVTRNLVVCLTINAAAGDAKLRSTNSTNAERTLTFSTALTGLGLVYYDDAFDISFALSGGPGGFFVDDNGTRVVEANPGVGFAMALGKEWWVSPSWALGATAQIVYIEAPDKDPSFGRWSSLAPAFLFSATYN